MAGQPDPVNTLLDQLVAQVQETFHASLLAHTTLELGGDRLDYIGDNVAVQTTVGLNIEIEPIPVRELKQYKTVLPGFLLQVFHGKMVQIWQDCLTKIFSHYVDLHLNGTRKFTELKTADVRLDFRSNIGIDEQIRDCIIGNFEFERYAERHKLINAVRNPTGLYPDYLANVLKNVLIRNALQHRNGMVDAYFLNSLGVQEVQVLGEDGKLRVVRQGEAVTLSIPEFDAFRRSLLMVGQAWRF